MEKLFITAEELLKSSFELGLKIFESEFNPTHIIGIWRGGAPIGIAVHEILDLLGHMQNTLPLELLHIKE